MSVTAPSGFRAAGVAAGLKESGQPDVAVVLNDGPSRAAAGVFTSNRVQAAPVLWTRQVVSGGRVRAVVLNSGGANACTGAPGFQDTHATAEHLAQAIDDSPGEIAVCSTGLIGERLPMDKLLPGVDAAVAAVSRAGGLFAADAIRTTDTVVKIAFRHGGTIADRLYTIGGMAKGAGMLAPALATMLCVLTTDADLGAAELDEALRSAVAGTFDRLDADGKELVQSLTDPATRPTYIVDLRGYGYHINHDPLLINILRRDYVVERTFGVNLVYALKDHELSRQ